MSDIPHLNYIPLSEDNDTPSKQKSKTYLLWSLGLLGLFLTTVLIVLFSISDTRNSLLAKTWNWPVSVPFYKFQFSL
jgi:hypothetical protein